MEEKKENKVLAYVKKHAISICAWTFLFALIISVVWLFVFGNYEQALNQNLGVENAWSSLWGTGRVIAALAIAGVVLVYALCEFDVDYMLPGFLGMLIFWLGTSTLLLWGWFCGVPFIVPIALGSIFYVTYSYKKHESKRSFIWDMVRFMVVMVAVCIGTYSLSQNKIDEFHQEIALIKMVVREPVIEVADAKSDCILTKEHGLEQVINDAKPQKGDKIHRLSVGKGEVYVIICNHK